MNNNFEELDQRFLEITRDLTNSLGHELLTDELIVVKEHLFNLIHQFHFKSKTHVNMLLIVKIN